MSVPAEVEAEWNGWYSGEYIPGYRKVPGVIIVAAAIQALPKFRRNLPGSSLSIDLLLTYIGR